MLGAFILLAIPQKVTAIPDFHNLPKSDENLHIEEIMVADPQIVQQLYENQKKQKPITQRSNNASTGFSSYSCVSYAKFRTGFSKSVGDARNWPRNTSQPIVGGVIITNESRAGHVAYITSVGLESIEVIEANYFAGKVTTRTIKLNNPIIIGFWRSHEL